MQATASLSQHSSVYSIVTEQIINQLKAGVAPWHKPWTTQPAMNLASGKPYRGINVFLLGTQSYASPYWLTYKQATERGGHVRKGQHGTQVVFWKIGKYEREDSDGNPAERTSVLLRYYTVFNVEQCEGIAYPGASKVNNPIEACERIVADMPKLPGITQDSRAWYRPSTDT